MKPFLLIPATKPDATPPSTDTKPVKSKQKHNSSNTDPGKHQRNIGGACGINQKEFRLIIERLEKIESTLILEGID